MSLKCYSSVPYLHVPCFLPNLDMLVFFHSLTSLGDEGFLGTSAHTGTIHSTMSTEQSVYTKIVTDYKSFLKNNPKLNTHLSFFDFCRGKYSFRVCVCARVCVCVCVVGSSHNSVCSMLMFICVVMFVFRMCAIVLVGFPTAAVCLYTALDTSVCYIPVLYFNLQC